MRNSSQSSHHSSIFTIGVLQAWRIGSRVSVLTPFDRFGTNLRSWSDAFVELEATAIDDPDLDIDHTTNFLWRLMSDIDIVENMAKLIAHP